MQDGLDMSALTNFTRNYIERAQKQYPNEVKKHMRSQGNKLKKKIVNNAKAKTNKKTGNYVKGFKRGKPYKYNSTEDAIRVYNYRPHGHLIEKGHRIVDKNGIEHGFKDGIHVVEDTSKEFESEFIQNTEKWVDDMLEAGH